MQVYIYVDVYKYDYLDMFDLVHCRNICTFRDLVRKSLHVDMSNKTLIASCKILCLPSEKQGHVVVIMGRDRSKTSHEHRLHILFTSKVRREIYVTAIKTIDGCTRTRAGRR